MSLIKQTVLPLTIVIVTLFATFTSIAHYYSKNALITQAEKSLERDTNLIFEKLRFYDELLRDNANRLSHAFVFMVNGEIELDTSKIITIGEYESPYYYSTRNH